MAKLTKQSKYLLTVGLLASAGMVVSHTFINVFLLRITEGNLPLMVTQNLIQFATLLLAFIVGTRLLRRINIKTILSLGLFLMAIYYIGILIFSYYLNYFLIPLAFIIGFGSGFFWFSINLLVGKIIKESEQGRYFGYQATAGSVFSVLTPALSGFVITQFTDLTGYYLLFGFAFILFISAILFLKNVDGFTSHKVTHVMPILTLKGNKYWNALKYYSFINAIREAIDGQIFMLFAFFIFQNEGVIGNWMSATAIIAVFSSYWFAKICKKENQQRFYLIVACTTAFLLLCLALVPTKNSLILFLIMTAFIGTWGGIILQSVFFQLSERAPRLTKNKLTQNDFLVAIEFPTACGRILGMGVTLFLIPFFPNVFYLYRLLFVFLAIAWLAEYFIMEFQVKWLRDELDC